MTMSGDVGSGTGSEPMVRYGEKPQRRGKPYKKLKKGDKKMKSFREFAEDEVLESPVGQVGRTKDSEALAHIENASDIQKKFKKIVRELGGVAVAKQLLSGMTQSGKKVSPEAEVIEEAKTMSPNKFLRDLGFKIKAEKYEKHSFNMEFFNEKDCKEAYQELLDKDFTDFYVMTRVGKFIEFEEL